MNDIVEPASFSQHLKPISPRPPAVGKEVVNFHEARCQFSAQAKAIMEHPESILSVCAEKGADCMDGSVNPSPPPAYKWAQGFHCLLEDIQGVTLFQKFVNSQGHDRKCLDFLFACRGVKKTDPMDKKNLYELINKIYRIKIRRINAISLATKEEIAKRLSSNKGVDVDILDNAQAEVEAYLQKTAYPNFLRSDLYIQLLGDNLDRECTVSPEPIVLPTVSEDSVLNIPVTSSLTKENFQQRWRVSAFKSKPEEQTGSYLKSPYSYSSNYSAYHVKYAPFLPTSAQDSELQSLSSDTRSEDTLFFTDSTIDFSKYTGNHKKQQKTKNGYGILNSDKLSHIDFIPRTQRVPEPQHRTPEEFHAALLKKLNKVVEDRKTNEKLAERLKSIEGMDSAKPEVSMPVSKPQKSTEPTFDSGFLIRPIEDNAQDILDQHVSNVFKDSGLTPAISPGCISPPAPCTLGEELRSRLSTPAQCDLQATPDTMYSLTQKNGSRYKRDIKTRSNDSGAICKSMSEDNLCDIPSCSEEQHSSGKRSKDQLKRYSRKLSHADSRSLVDSGISVACESTHPASHSSSSRKSINQACSRWMENGQGSFQPLVQDNFVPAFPPPDITTNLLEARRRLEDDARPRFNRASGRSSHDVTKGKSTCRASDSFKDGFSHRKQNKRSSDNSGNSVCNETTLVGYSFGRHAAPFSRRLPGKNITLGKFKFFLNKPGNFRFFFKKVCNDFGTGVVFEEVTDDHEVLPLWEGKVFCVIDSLDNSPVANSEFSRHNKF